MSDELLVKLVVCLHLGLMLLGECRRLRATLPFQSDHLKELGIMIGLALLVSELLGLVGQLLEFTI